MANHTLIFLNAPGFVNEDYRRISRGQSFAQWKAEPGGVVEFIKRFRDGEYGIVP